MKLFFSDASPYSRKCRIVALEKDLAGRITEEVVSVFDDPPALIAVNPLGKLPTLLLDDGEALYDSPVICAYLDAHPDGKGERLRPHSGMERWMVMRAEALGDGMMDLAFSLTMERRKPDAEKSPTSAARWRGQLLRCLDTLPDVLCTLPQPFNLGTLTLACALGYIDLRHPDMEWRKGRDGLAAWYGEIARRDSIEATRPA